MLRLHRQTEDLDYAIDWTAELDDQGSPSDTISSSIWDLVGPDDGSSPSPELHSDSINQATGQTITFVRNLQRGVYRLRNYMTTTSNRVHQKEITIRVVD